MTSIVSAAASCWRLKQWRMDLFSGASACSEITWDGATGSIAAINGCNKFQLAYYREAFQCCLIPGIEETDGYSLLMLAGAFADGQVCSTA